MPTTTTESTVAGVGIRQRVAEDPRLSGRRQGADTALVNGDDLRTTFASVWSIAGPVTRGRDNLAVPRAGR